MAKDIEPRLKTIGDYLSPEKDPTNDPIFVIPEYQRAYSWELYNCDKLWQDINQFVETKGRDSYFFGTIIINCQNDDTTYSLIDGQQRTTTFLLLLKALLLNINEAILNTLNDEDSISLCKALRERRKEIMKILYKIEPEEVPDNPNKEKDVEICNNVDILHNQSINENYPTELHTILKYTDYNLIEDKVKKIKYKQNDNKYTNYFRNFKFFLEKVKQLTASQVNKITKTLLSNCQVIEIKSWNVEQAINMFNSLNSDGLPLFDSDIISAKLYANAKAINNEKEFANLWKQLNDEIDEFDSLGIMNINAILMQYMYYVRAKNKEILSETGSIIVTTPGLRRYFTEINKEPLYNPIQMCQDLLRLVKIWKVVYELPQMKVLLKFNENTKIFLAGYFLRFDDESIKQSKVDVIIECMLRLFAILEVVDIGFSSKQFKMFLFEESIKLVNENISEYEIKNDFDNQINSNWNIKEVSELIGEYDKNILVYLNEYLFAKNNKMKFELVSKCDIEHIMPYSGNNIQMIRIDAHIKDEEEFKSIVNKLGNKILLEQKINRSIGNEWFRTKVSTRLIDKTGYVDSVYPIASALVSKYHDDTNPYWDKDKIIDATNDVSKRMSDFIFYNQY